MAAGGVAVKSVKNSRGIAQSLAFAVLEWFLLALLFISALISYSVTKFARYCGLETPCLLCSRLDHVLGNEKLGFYWDMICRNHKSEISSMVLCHAHSNLVDVHGMCENCLFSFATINKSNAETYRLLVGKLGAHEEESFSDGGCDSTTKLCYCCSQPRGRASRFIQTELPEVDVPLGAIDHYVEKTLIKTNIEDEDFHQKNRDIGTLPDVGYTELKINSDTESDALFSDDDETGALISNKVVSIDLAAMEPLVSVSLDETSLDQIGEVVEASGKNSNSSSPSVHEMEVDAVEDHKDVYEVHGLDEINWQSNTPPPSPVPELISFDDFPSSTNDDPSPTLVKLTSENYVAEANGSAPSGSDGILEVETEPITKAENSTKENLISSSSYGPKILNLVDLGDAAYELTVGHRRRQLSGVLEEQWPESDSPKVGEDLLGSNEDASIKLAQIVEEKEEEEEKEASLGTSSSPPSETNPGQIMEEEASAIHSSPPPAKVSREDETLSGQIVEKGEEEASDVVGDAGEAHKDVYEVPTAAAGSGPEEETNRQTSESKPSQLIISSNDFPSTTNDDEPVPTLVKLPSESYAEETNGSDKPTEAYLVSTGSSPKVALDLVDAYKLAIGSRARQLSGVLAEQWLGKESPRVSEDLRNLLSQLSASRAFERSPSDLSPKVPEEVNKASLDASNSIGLEILQKRISLERNESNLSYDGSIVSEIEGESVLERLKRQIEHDRRAMRVLYKELEEERNASSVAANQAMAMITRLQEEKAALHMEALQYLRMMEEQEEYDSEALLRSNQLLAEKEKEIQELEQQLEFYKNSLDLGNINDTLLCIEDERLQLQQCVDDLEKKLRLSLVDDDDDVNCSNKEEEAAAEGVDLVKEVLYLKEKLEGIERDRGFLERAIKYLRIGDEGLLFIQDIASNLQEMRSNSLKMDHNA